MKKMVAFLSIVLVSAGFAFAQNNSVVFDNQSGEPALVKLIGPTSAELQVAGGAKGTVAAAAGRYQIKVRYGVPGKFRFAKGEEFDVTETATTRSETTITLQKVVGGNYETQDISEAEFGSADPNGGIREAVALQNPMWSWMSSTGKFQGAYALEKQLVGESGASPTVVAKCGKPIQLDQVIKKWGKPQAEKKADLGNTWFWIKSFQFESFAGNRILKYPKISLLVEDGAVVQAAFFGAETQKMESSAATGNAGKENVSVSSGSLTMPPAPSDKSLRVPPGFRAASGTAAEPYTNTGWAKEVIHEKTGIEMVLIPAGEFQMGSPSGESGHRSGESPVHRVRITKPFYLGKYEVTQAEYQKVMKENLSRFKGDRNPVETVSWNECQDFVNNAGDGLRLPTEAEWEYACRAGTATAFYFGDTISTDQGNYDGNYTYGNGRKGVYRERTAEVGNFPPNGWGLYDMHGNVFEWCADWYGNTYYAASPADDPQGPTSGSARVVRGGSWACSPIYCRSGRREAAQPVFAGFGLRVARTIE